MADKVFISYRRDDEQGYAVRLYERLAESFGKERLFFDVDSIPIGFDFVSYIERQIGLSDVVLVVIGRNWLNAADEHGQCRLENPEDFVRIEIESALEQGKHVIPVLVQGAVMPLSTQLPPKLRPLARRNAFFASHVGFRAETERLIASLRGMKKLIEAEKRIAAVSETIRVAQRNDAATLHAAVRQESAGSPDEAQAIARDPVARPQDTPVEEGAEGSRQQASAVRGKPAPRPPALEGSSAKASDGRAGTRFAGESSRFEKPREAATTPSTDERREARVIVDTAAPISARSFGSRFVRALLFMSAIVIVGVGAYLGFDAVSSWPEAKTTIPPTIAAAPPAAAGQTDVQPEALIGMTIADAQESTVASFGVEDRKEAAIVTDIDQNKAAFRAGIKIGFLILKVNGVDKFSRRQVLEAVAEAIRNEDASVVFTMRSSWMNRFDVTKTVELGRQ